MAVRRFSPDRPPARWLRQCAVAVLGAGLMLATLQLHSGATHPAMSRPAPVSVGASHAHQSAHLDGLLSLEKDDCTACVLRDRGQFLDPEIPSAARGLEPGAALSEPRGSLALLSVYRLGPTRAPPRA